MRPLSPPAALLPTLLCGLFVSGCPAEDEPAGASPSLGGTPAQARQACEDFVDHAGAMLQRTCAPQYSLEELEAELESGFESRFGAGCEGADGIRDADAFYEACLPGLDAMDTCPEDGTGTMPESCSDQLQFVADR